MHASHIPYYTQPVPNVYLQVFNMDLKKRSLFEELRHKMGFETKDDQEPTRKSARLQMGNKNASKETRMIHLGWIHDGKPIRIKTGGGIRKLIVPKNLEKSALIEESKRIFESGILRRGGFDMFDYDIMDYSEISMPLQVSVGDVYEQTKTAGTLKFYFSTKTKASGDTTTAEEIPQPTVAQADLNLQVSTSSIQPIFESQICQLETIDVLQPLDDAGKAECQLLNVNLSQDFSAQEMDIVTFPTPNPDVAIQFGPAEESAVGEQITLEVGQTKESVYRFHRSNIFPEMVACFQSDIIYTPMKVELIGELGSDADGVSREIYTLFWNEMYEKCEGEYFRVPVISPEFGIEEWKSVARILCKGYIDHRIFPLKFAPVFMMSLFEQEESFSDEMMLSSFKLFNNSLDRELIENVLEAGFNCLSSDDKDAFLDLIGRCGSHENPATCSTSELLRKIAHKCLIQMPAFIIKAMKETVQQHLKAFFPDEKNILKVYDECKPTPQKLCSLLQTNDDITYDENRCLGYLKQFIRGLNTDKLIKVLVLMTASSMIAVEKISVRFTKLRGLERRPIFHTCGPVLELPCTYCNYRDLRQEWNAIIEEGQLQMDIA